MLIVRVFEHEVESVLRSGEGPVLERGAVCPGCQGKLSPWGSYRRYVRQEAATQLRVRRAICKSCGETHALLPSFLFGRRIDLARAIFTALVVATTGVGHRPLARSLGLPKTTVRSWLRCLRSRADPLRQGFALIAQRLAVQGPRPPPTANALALLLHGVEVAYQGAAQRFGLPAIGPVWAFTSMATGGWLMSNTDSPFPGRA